MKEDWNINNKKMQNQDSPNKETKKEETLSILSNTNSNTINASDKQNSQSLNNNTNSNEFYTANKENSDIRAKTVSNWKKALKNENDKLYCEKKNNSDYEELKKMEKIYLLIPNMSIML